ncbi:GNAT family N-acetyltransferase [Vagococcus sp. BWB3-3]|uniref:GNAT family N-acetyltransferase n=1 Tax=Vagococcus allomyrinae TaxID=2794353 RepID=A0A940SXY8_9ENTE|nr:GNAT family N-acetyltransferase [Vagococcus allomyrinae]MBP1043841.1 GNAT family N-acetyltransferase [Vagococcus allomyrinae]
MSTQVSLRKYNPQKDQSVVANYQLTNATFTAHPKEKVKELTEDGQLFPLFICHEEVVVGFFCLNGYPATKEFTDNPKSLLLRALSIDERYRGKGFGKGGMEALAGFLSLEFPQCDEIVLAVNHKNIPAQSLYLELGFEDTGRRLNGPLGEQFVYRKEVKRLLMRKVMTADYEIIQRWWNDGETMAAVGFPKGLNISLNEVSKIIQGKDSANGFLVIDYQGKAIGEFTYKKEMLKTFSMGMKIGSAEFRGKGLGRRALQLGLNYLFDELAATKVTLEVNTENARAIKLYEQAGFKQVGYHHHSWQNQLEQMMSSYSYELTKTIYKKAVKVER